MGLVTRTPFGMSGKIVSVFFSMSYMMDWLFATMNTRPSGKAKARGKRLAGRLPERRMRNSSDSPYNALTLEECRRPSLTTILLREELEAKIAIRAKNVSVH